MTKSQQPRVKAVRGTVQALARRWIAGEFLNRKYDDVALEAQSTGDSLRTAVCRLRSRMADWKTRTPPAPRLAYAAAHEGRIASVQLDAAWRLFPCAVVPCRTQREARALVRQFTPKQFQH